MTALPDRPEDVEPANPGEVLPPPSGWSDPLTGADGPRLWDRVMTNEQARLRRYGGSVTIVLLELGGFTELATWVGRDVAVQAFGRLSHVIAGEIRSSDHIARVAPNRFAVLLIQTDDVKTLNFIDRLLRACQPEMEALGDLIRIGVGWASPSPAHHLTAAMSLAEARLASDFFATMPPASAGEP